MNRKYRIMITAAVICCIAVTGCAALLQITRSGSLLYREPSDSYEISLQSESGTYLSAWIEHENEQPRPASAADAPKAEYIVNINTATAKELSALLPGIGDRKAAAIVEYREQTGGFRSVEELCEVDGIGPKLLETLRPYCVISEENTAG